MKDKTQKLDIVKNFNLRRYEITFRCKNTMTKKCFCDKKGWSALYSEWNTKHHHEDHNSKVQT